MSGLLHRLREALRPAEAGAAPPADGLMWLRWLGGVVRHFSRRFRENNIMALSAALSFRTIFALIPALVLAFLAAKSLGVLEDGKRSLRQFLEASGFAQIAAVPDEAAADASAAPGPNADEAPASDLKVINLADKIEEAVTTVESKLTFDRIGPIGAGLLVWTALTLLMTMERSLNRVFGAANDRSLARSMVLYWAVLTLGPLLLALTAYMAQRSMNAMQETFSPGAMLIAAFSNLGQVVVSVIVLALVYDRLPTASVPFRAGLAGAVVAVALWLLAKWGFSVYVQQLVLKGNLYGVLGVFPLFLMWLNFCWMIFLFGAEVAGIAADPGQLRQAHEAEPALLGPSDYLAGALALAQRFRDGRSPVSCGEIGAELHLTTEATRRVLSALTRAGCVVETMAGETPRYALARAAETIRVPDLLALGDPRAARHARGATATGAGLARVTDALGGAVERLTLADLLPHPAPGVVAARPAVTGT